MNESQSDYEKIVISHYNSKEVQEEIVRFSQNRWVALHCEFLNPQGYPVLLRYQRTTGKEKKPLRITNIEGVLTLLRRFERLRPRTFYASANVYKELTLPEHVKSLDNIAFCLPTWDIDNALSKWKATVAVAKEIVGFLERAQVSKSVFLKWSGNGVHVHIHHRAFSTDLLRKINPLDAAYAIVGYVNIKLHSKYAEIAAKHGARELSVENEMDLQRVFTCPLSLHRSLNLVAVCFSSNMLDDFTPAWASLERYRHLKEWDQFEEGEADSLAKEAYQTVGTYPLKTRSATSEQKRRTTANVITKWFERK